MRGIFQKVVVVTMVTVLTLSVGMVSFATTASEAKKKKSALEAEKKEIQAKITKLRESKSDILTKIKELDDYMTELNDKVAENEKNVTETEESLEKIEIQLEKTQEEMGIQYDAMKSRIKYIYENGSSDYFELVLGSESIEQLLNRTEYIGKISDYDNKMYQAYEEKANEIKKTQEAQKAKLEELKVLKESLEYEQKSVETLIADKNEELQKHVSQISNNQTEVANIEVEEEELEKIISASAAGGSVVNGSTTGFRWPLNISATITCSFGYRKSPTTGASSNHEGIDIGAPAGTTIVAANSGTVLRAGYQSKAGNFVQINHGNGYVTVYYHCSRIFVSTGQSVSKGEKIAAVGSTGVSTGNHLHFGVKVNGTFKNPLNYVSKP